jgi:hypothetical protein
VSSTGDEPENVYTAATVPLSRGGKAVNREQARRPARWIIITELSGERPEMGFCEQQPVPGPSFLLFSLDRKLVLLNQIFLNEE